MNAQPLPTRETSALDALHVLLIQARDTDPMERQERACFLERCRLRPEQMTCINVARAPLPPDALRAADALLIGGAGEYSALDDPDWMADLLDLVRAAVERGVPTFGSCWGHQIIARALGGTVVRDPARAELGCKWIELTEGGRANPLLGGFPTRFQANTGHHDRVHVLPPGAVELAFNASQRHQAFRIAGKPVYGTQFHSELDAARERERLIVYRDYYRDDLPDEDDFQHVLDALAETTEVDHLLYDFLRRYAAPSGPQTADGGPPVLGESV